MEGRKYQDQQYWGPLMSAETSDLQLAVVPRITIEAWCKSQAAVSITQDVMKDRRMSKPHMATMSGGLAGALQHYQNNATPSLILLEADEDRSRFLRELDQLAEYCDANTRVIALGRTNDILFYRELLARGVSEYLVEPYEVVDFVRAISQLYSAQSSGPLGRIIAFYGAKGGAGASTLAHNVAWCAANKIGISTVLADLDLPFGTAALDFNQDPAQGIADAVMAPDRLDGNVLDRLLTKIGGKLSLLAAPVNLEQSYDFDEEGFDSLTELLRATVPLTIFDIPHGWSGWVRRMMLAADEVVIVSEPELASLRNVKNMIDRLTIDRPNDRRPKVVLNKVNVPKRPEIKLDDFAKAIGFAPFMAVDFDTKNFGTAANNGQMLSELPNVRASAQCLDLAYGVTQKSEPKGGGKGAKQDLLGLLKSGTLFKSKKSS
jgi:pilus assembly protein CpaE